MRMNEIAVNPLPHDIDMNDFSGAIFGETAKTVHQSGANKLGVPWVLVKASTSFDTYGVLENGELIGALTVVEGEHGRTVDTVATRPDRRNHGVIRFIIDWTVGKEGPLCSSVNQTQKAKEMWQGLIAYPGKRKFFAITKKEPAAKVLLKQSNINLPWDDPDTFILVENNIEFIATMERVEADPRRRIPMLYGGGNDEYGNP